MIYAQAFGAAPQKECWRCHKMFPTLTRVQYVSGLVKDTCGGCIDKDRARGLIKKIMRAV